MNRKESWWLRSCYYVFYRLLAALSPLRLPLDAGDFGLMSRRVIDEIRKMPEHHRYLRGLRTWVGFRQVGIAIERSARRAGRTKYSPLKLLKLASDGIFAFSIVPLRAAAILGAVAIGLSTPFSLYSIYVKFWLHSPYGRMGGISAWRLDSTDNAADGHLPKTAVGRDENCTASNGEVMMMSSLLCGCMHGSKREVSPGAPVLCTSPLRLTG